MKNKLLLFVFVTGLFATHCLEGMDQESELLKQNFEQLEYKKIKYREIEFNCGASTDEVSERLKVDSNTIKKLDFRKCTNIKWKYVKWPMSSSLEDLDFSFTKITTYELRKILEKYPNLKRLNLFYCRQIIWKKVRWNLLPKLEFLNIGCPAEYHSFHFATEETLGNILDTCKNLREFCIQSYGSNIVKRLRDKYRGCKIDNFAGFVEMIRSYRNED